MLADLGHHASVWHWTRYHPYESRRINGKYSTYFNFGTNIKRQDDPHRFTYEHATLEDIDDAAVIYPEIVKGNPIGGKRVVCWLLNKPGAILGAVAFRVDELTFFFEKHFLPDRWEADPSRKLKII